MAVLSPWGSNYMRQLYLIPTKLSLGSSMQLRMDAHMQDHAPISMHSPAEMRHPAAKSALPPTRITVLAVQFIALKLGIRRLRTLLAILTFGSAKKARSLLINI